MQRKTKNILMFGMLTLLIALLTLTIYTATNGIRTNNNHMPPMNEIGGTPPEMPGGNKEDSQRPAKSNEDNNEVTNNKNGSGGDTPSKKPDENTKNNDTNTNNENTGTPPEMPNGNNKMGNTPPEMPNNKNINSHTSLTWPYYLSFGIEGLGIAILTMYLILSKANKKTFNETFADSDTKTIAILGTIILTITIMVGSGLLTTNINTIPTDGGNMIPPGESSAGQRAIIGGDTL